MLLSALLAFAADASPTVPDLPPPPPEIAADASPPPDEPADETVYIYGNRAVQKAREELTLKLRSEGYTRHERQGNVTIYKNTIPYHPQVIVHDDGWIYLRRQPPRIHSPGHSFADQGNKLNYLWCIPTLGTACVSVGGWAIGERKLSRLQGDVLDATRTEVETLNTAVMREHLLHRLNVDIPSDLARIWTDDSLPPDMRHAILYTYWDLRTDGEAGDAARGAIRAYLIGVVQASKDPITTEELRQLNAGRKGLPALDLPTR